MNGVVNHLSVRAEGLSARCRPSISRPASHVARDSGAGRHRAGARPPPGKSGRERGERRDRRRARPRADAPRQPAHGPAISRRFVVLAGMVLTVARALLGARVAYPSRAGLAAGLPSSPWWRLRGASGCRVPAAVTVGFFALLVAGGPGLGPHCPDRRPRERAA